MIEHTTFLFARPSLWEGIGRLIDFGNTLQVYNTSPSSAEADMVALAMDWKAIGDDMRRAVREIAESRTTGEYEQTEAENVNP